MKRKIWLMAVFPVLLASCGSSKTYFTSAIRRDVEESHQDLQKIQFYVDRDIVLRRELDNGEVKVNSGKVRFENGHYVNIVTLKKNTPGVCTLVRNDIVGISFESGDQKFLTFGKTKYAKPDDPYRILANEWVKDYGVVYYDGKQYKITPAGTEASIMIQSKWLKHEKVDSREMKGRKVAG